MRRLKPAGKAPTGITGLDEATGGGLPRGCTTLAVGGAGSGKIILALQFLIHGAQHLQGRTRMRTRRGADAAIRRRR
jgi:KaiC/GvpD/RAD55 family RecA-like ATPase